ncbi:hypothetical protein ES703_59531 [subsurface metagenome]
MAGEGDVHYFREVLVEFVGNHLAEVGGEELFVRLLDVTSFLDGADDCGVGAWPADAFFFECLYQGAFSISSRRFGEMLLGLDINCR